MEQKILDNYSKLLAKNEDASDQYNQIIEKKMKITYEILDEILLVIKSFLSKHNEKFVCFKNSSGDIHHVTSRVVAINRDENHLLVNWDYINSIIIPNTLENIEYESKWGFNDDFKTYEFIIYDQTTKLSIHINFKNMKDLNMIEADLNKILIFGNTEKEILDKFDKNDKSKSIIEIPDFKKTLFGYKYKPKKKYKL